MVEGARDSLHALSRQLDIVVLTNIAPAQAAARAAQSGRASGSTLPLVANSGLKGEAVKALAARAGRPSFFVDDIPQQPRLGGGARAGRDAHPSDRRRSAEAASCPPPSTRISAPKAGTTLKPSSSTKLSEAGSVTCGSASTLAERRSRSSRSTRGAKCLRERVATPQTGYEDTIRRHARSGSCGGEQARTARQRRRRHSRCDQSGDRPGEECQLDAPDRSSARPRSGRGARPAGARRERRQLLRALGSLGRRGGRRGHRLRHHRGNRLRRRHLCRRTRADRRARHRRRMGTQSPARAHARRKSRSRRTAIAAARAASKPGSAARGSSADYARRARTQSHRRRNRGASAEGRCHGDAP